MLFEIALPLSPLPTKKPLPSAFVAAVPAGRIPSSLSTTAPGQQCLFPFPSLHSFGEIQITSCFQPNKGEGTADGAGRRILPPAKAKKRKASAALTDLPETKQIPSISPPPSAVPEPMNKKAEFWSDANQPAKDDGPTGSIGKLSLIEVEEAKGHIPGPTIGQWQRGTRKKGAVEGILAFPFLLIPPYCNPHYKCPTTSPIFTFLLPFTFLHSTYLHFSNHFPLLAIIFLPLFPLGIARLSCLKNHPLDFWHPFFHFCFCRHCYRHTTPQGTSPISCATFTLSCYYCLW